MPRKFVRRRQPHPTRDEDLRPDHIPAAGHWPAIYAFASATYLHLPHAPDPSTLGPRARRRWESHRELPPDLPSLRAALYFEQRRWRHLKQSPTGWPQAPEDPYVEALLAAIRALVASQPRLPPVFTPAEGVVPLAPYRETQYIRVSQLKRHHGVEPKAGDDDDWVTVVQSDGDPGPMVRLHSLTLHPVDWVPGFRKAVTLPVQVGPARLLENPLMTLEQWMIAMAAAAEPVEPEPLHDVHLSWLDGRRLRLPVPLYHGPREWGDTEGWNTPGVSQCLIRYGEYFSGHERWTDWDPLGISDWERLLARLPASARKEVAAFRSGSYEVQGGLWWQRFWLGDPHAGETPPPHPTT